MSQKYIITKSAFLGGWAVTSPTWTEDNGYGPTVLAEGTIVDSMPAALEWAQQHAAGRWSAWVEFYESHTAAEPAY